MFFGSSSNQYGSPQAEFEIPYGNLGQNGPYGQVAQRYAAVYGYDERAMAKVVVDQRFNANQPCLRVRQRRDPVGTDDADPRGGLIDMAACERPIPVKTPTSAPF